MKNSIENNDMKVLSLQALRALAFLGIFLSHANSDISWPALGVSIFYVLSGFLMYSKHGDEAMESSIKDNFKYSWKRISKLYPLHIITMCCAIILELASRVSRGLTLQGIMFTSIKTILNITLLQTWIPYSSINVSLNGVAWYLSVSMFLYFMFPIIRKKISKRKNISLFISCVLLLLAEIIVCIPWIALLGDDSPVYVWFMYCFPLFRFGDFYVGCCLGKLQKEGKLEFNLDTIKATVLEMLATLITVLIFQWMKIEGGLIIKSTHNWTTLFIPVAVVWIILFTKKEGVFTRLLCNKVTYFVGDISPYIFLIHYVVTCWTNAIMSYFRFEPGFLLKYSIILAELLLSILLSLVYKKIKNSKKQIAKSII